MEVARKEPESLDNDKFDLIQSLQDQGDDSDCVSSYSDAASDNGEEIDENVQRFVNDEYKKIRSQANINKEVEFIVFQPLIDPYTGLEGLQSRHRLSKEQIKYLELEFEKNPFWDKAHQKKIAVRLNFSLSKVYKWNYDQKIRQGLMKKWTILNTLNNIINCNF